MNSQEKTKDSTEPVEKDSDVFFTWVIEEDSIFRLKGGRPALKVQINGKYFAIPLVKL